MKRWRQLLKASKTITDTYNGENPVAFKAIGALLAIWCMVKTTQSVQLIDLKLDSALNIHYYVIQLVWLLIVVNMMTSLFTGFSKSIRTNNKNDFIQLATQFPIVKEDFFKAYYWGIIFNFIPTIVTLIYIIILHGTSTSNNEILIYTGATVFLFCSIVILQTLEIGFYMYTNISTKFKFVGYIGIYIIVVLTIIKTRDRVNSGIGKEIMKFENILNILRFLGTIGGSIVILTSLFIAYLCAVKLPLAIYKIRQGVYK